MRMAGLEPARGRPRQILSLMRLPFRHIRNSFSETYYITGFWVLQALKQENFLEISGLFWEL